MKKAALIVIIILVTILLAFSMGQDTPPTSMVPESAKWVVHFDMNQFSRSNLYNQLMKDNRISRMKRKNDRLIEKYGIDIFKDLDSLTLFNVGRDEEDTVVCLQGDFDMARLLGLLDDEESHREIAHGNFTIHRWDRHQHGVFASERMVLLSQNLDALELALDVYTGKAEGIAGAWPAIGDLLGKSFLVGAVRQLSDIIHDHDSPIVLKNMEQAHFALAEERDSLALQASLTAGSDSEAQKLEDVVKGLLALASLQTESREHGIKIPEDITIVRSGKTLDLRMLYPIGDMLDMLSAQLGHRASGLFDLDFF